MLPSSTKACLRIQRSRPDRSQAVSPTIHHVLAVGRRPASSTHFLHFRFFFGRNPTKKVISQKMDSIFHLPGSRQKKLLSFSSLPEAQSNQLMGRKSLHLGMRVRFKCAAPGSRELFVYNFLFNMFSMNLKWTGGSQPSGGGEGKDAFRGRFKWIQGFFFYGGFGTNTSESLRIHTYVI